MDKHVPDLDAERLFAGDSVPDPAQPLTRFVADVRGAFAAPPAEPTRATHLAAMTQVYADLVATVRSGPAVRPPSRRRRFIVRGGVAAAALILVSGSAMAATGTLPDAAQDAVSRVARSIGVKLPRADRPQIKIVHPDVDPSDIDVKVADKRPADDDDRVSRSDDDSDDDGGIATTTTRRPRRPRNSTGGPTTVIDDGGGSTEPDDPSGGGGGGGGGGGRGDPSDGDGGSDQDPEPDPDDGEGGGRGDPIDGSPSGADAGGGGDPAPPGGN